MQMETTSLSTRLIRAALVYISSDLPATRKLCGFYGVNAMHGCSKINVSRPFLVLTCKQTILVLIGLCGHQENCLITWNKFILPKLQQHVLLNKKSNNSMVSVILNYSNCHISM